MIINEKIEEQKLKNLPIKTCMKKIIYDYGGKNNLNSEITSNNKEMEIDNIFSNLLLKLKEKKENNVEPKRFSEFSFSNYVNKGPMRFFNVVINRKISENRCSSALTPNKNYGEINRSSHSSINSNFNNCDLMNKKIIEDKNKLIKNEQIDRIAEIFKRSGNEKQTVNKNSSYNSEKDKPLIKISNENSENFCRSESYNKERKANLGESSIPFHQEINKNKTNLTSISEKNNAIKITNDEIKINFFNSKKNFSAPNSLLGSSSDLVIGKLKPNKNDILRSDGNSVNEIKKNNQYGFDISLKNNNLIDIPSNETTNSNSQNSSANTLFYNVCYKPMINTNFINIDKGIVVLYIFLTLILLQNILKLN